MYIDRCEKTINKYDFLYIDNYVNRTCTKNIQFSYLINKLEKLGDIIMIGGAIRDIVVKKCKPRDIDLIIDTDENLDSIMKQFKNVHKNRFGGYKIFLEDLELDIWTIDNHWAFREQILEKSFDNIKYSTFLNFDSVFYNLSRKIGCADMFNKAVRTAYLDIILEEEHIYKNPTKDINIIRMFIIEDDWNLKFSTKIEDYIFSWVSNQDNPVEILWEAQKKHYKKCIKISKERIKQKLEHYNACNI